MYLHNEYRYIMIYVRTRITGTFIGMIIMILPTENQIESISSKTVSVRRNTSTACSVYRQYVRLRFVQTAWYIFIGQRQLCGPIVYSFIVGNLRNSIISVFFVIIKCCLLTFAYPTYKYCCDHLVGNGIARRVEFTGVNKPISGFKFIKIVFFFIVLIDYLSVSFVYFLLNY